jgi:hypothetical protein
MLKLMSCLALIALVAAPFTVWAGEEEPPAAPAAPAAEKPAPVAKRVVDPAAMKLIDAAKKKLYCARAAGLEKVTCTVALKHPMLPIPVAYFVEYAAPNTAKASLKKLPAELEAMRPMLEPACAELARGTVNFYRREGFLDLEMYNITLKEGTKDTVLLSGFAAAVKDERVEFVFGENGLPTKMSQMRQGMQLTLTHKYGEKDGKFLLVGGQEESMAGASDVVFTREKVGKFWLITKLVKQGQMGAVELTYSDFKVNGEAAAPAAKPTDTPKTPETPGEKPGDKPVDDD